MCNCCNECNHTYDDERIQKCCDECNNHYMDECLQNYDCNCSDEVKVQTDKNTIKINEIIEQLNKLTQYIENIGNIVGNIANSDTVDYHHVMTLTISEYNSIPHDKDTLYFIKSEEV